MKDFIFSDFDNILYFIILDIVFLIVFTYRYFKNKEIDIGTTLFIEPTNIYRKAIIFSGIGLIFIIRIFDFVMQFNKANQILVWGNFLFFIVILINQFIYKRLLLTTKGIGYKNLFRFIAPPSFLYWESIDGYELEGLQLKIYLKDFSNSKLYYVDLSSDEKFELKKILNEYIKKRVV